MSINMVCLLGAFGCLLALTVLGVVATRTDDEVPLFVYGTGLVLVFAALILLVGAGDPTMAAPAVGR